MSGSQMNDGVAPTRKARLVVWVAFLTTYSLSMALLCLPSLIAGQGRWLEGLVLTLGVAVVLHEQARELPDQNVLLAAVTILIIVGFVQVASALMGTDVGIGLVAGNRSFFSSACLTVL